MLKVSLPVCEFAPLDSLKEKKSSVLNPLGQALFCFTVLLVYCEISRHINWFFFWVTHLKAIGQNALWAEL